MPDLIIAFDVNPEAYREDNEYVISRQGKPPDLVMEITSQRTGRTTWKSNRQDTPPWESLSTGDLMKLHLQRGSGWPETGWWTANTSPSP